MTRLSTQTIRDLCIDPISGEPLEKPLISPFVGEKMRVHGKSYGLSHASYDVRINHDLTLGVHPSIIWAKYMEKRANYAAQHDPAEDWGRTIAWWAQLDKECAEELAANPPYFSLAHTMEDFCFPDNVSGQVADKSTYARLFVSAFNTFFDPGFHGNATLELVNLSDQPVVYRAGDPVCQFLFDFLDQNTERPYDGKYQHQTKASHAARFEPDTPHQV